VNIPSRREVRRALPAGAQRIVDAVLAAAEERNLAVYLVGGPVRDLLLGRPVRDVDLLLEGEAGATAADLSAAVQIEDVRVVSHGRFGTVRLEGGGEVVDIATARRERYAHSGALPSVEPGSLEEDLRRRDFTVNALALPLSSAARRGKPALLGSEAGLEDLEAGVLRVFHDRCFHDDPTRALRAARLAERLGFSLSRGSRTALRDALRDGAFGRVSGERLRRELQKLFADSADGLDPARALRRLSEWHVLAALEPGLTLDREAVAPLRRLGRSIRDSPWPVGRFHPWVTGLALWLAPLPPGLTRRTLRRLAVRGETAKRIADFAKARDRWLRDLGRARGRGAIDRVLGEIEEDRLLALAASATPTVRRRVVRYANEDRPRRLPVSGADLVALGLSGPAVGRALARIRVAHLDGACRTRDEAIALARELAGRKGSAARPRSAKGRAAKKAGGKR
jgi:tRNA nucleotidyltransferase (CCA-adding enzyme)